MWAVALGGESERRSWRVAAGRTTNPLAARRLGGNGELEVVFRSPADELLRQIHETLATGRRQPVFPEL
jgi:hypothetical protein